eukprot:TRINITY_DN10928_c0_g1_i1.p1 TRINITY_DN10928_c0_g1~~TRINITY_DN10928_c0_g1_i1.p1  ORF type:complete len:511 (-),score=61.54 TRINITY_DN10928_c0_g1_i1:283-1815(-)
MEVSLEEELSPVVNIDTIFNDVEALIKRKEDANAVDLQDYQQTLQKIENSTNSHKNVTLLYDLPEEVVIRILQLHDRAQKLSWNKLSSKLRVLVVIAGAKQNHDVIDHIVEVLLNNKALSEEIFLETLFIGSSFDIVTWIKKGGNLIRLAKYLQQFKITRIAFGILHFVMAKPELADIVESELSVPILDIYLRLTKHKGATLALSVWQIFNQPKYFELIKCLSPEIKLDWLTFIVQHYEVQKFEEKYLDLFKSLVLSVDISLLPRAFRPGNLLSEHFFVKIMRDKQRNTFDFLMQVGYDFSTFKKKGRALRVAIQEHDAYFATELLKRKLLNLEEFELTEQDRSDLLKMKDLLVYKMMNAAGVDFTQHPLIRNTDERVNYPFMNVLMDWHMSKCQHKVFSLKRLCIIEVQAQKISPERLPHDLRDAIAEYKEPWYWLNWNEDKANKIYWKEFLQYLQTTARKVRWGIVDFDLKTINEDYMTIRMDVSGTYYRPHASLPEGYRNLTKDKYC